MASTCREAIQEVFANKSDELTTSQVVERIYKKYPNRPWKRNTISAHLIGLSVNHPSSKWYPSLRSHAFLFWLRDGRYRLWNKAQDGTWEIVDGKVQQVEPGKEKEIQQIEREIREKLRTLPIEKQRTVLGFAEFLQHRTL